ncbi:hypothetical protein LSH36_257g03081 [Paralvinella palmiformis]|uniref:Serine/threonine-protein phosphatase PGAM5, mitochondrial n=1 Tax=Paralvinella palmiformis TaxID=53620 RepID=A0AAD9N592_9ANNE|nr:hypothetical protein LSH36_257g03081 [Paralvinella palmiformis]
MQPAISSQTFGLGSIMRVAFIVGAVVMAAVLLLWIRIEQGHIERCASVVERGGIAASITAPPVHVIVHVRNNNRSVGNASTPPGRRRWNYNWDYMQPPNGQEAAGTATRVILMIRHGQYGLNDGRLTEKGRYQAKLTGMRLRALNIAFDRIVHSDLERATQTAQLIRAQLADLPMIADPMLVEGGPVPPEPTISYWSLPDRNYFVEGPRLEAAFRKYIYRAGKTQTNDTVDILVGHGNIFRYFMLRALQFPPAAWMRVFLPHGSISRLNILPDGTVTLSQFGDSGFMPPDYVTY